MALREQAARQIADQESWDDAWTDPGHVFTQEDGHAMHPDRVSKLFNVAVTESRLERIRLHELRHTVATRMLEAGIHPKAVSEILGHAIVAFTLDRYSHAIPAMKEDAVGRLAGLYA